MIRRVVRIAAFFAMLLTPLQAANLLEGRSPGGGLPLNLAIATEPSSSILFLLGALMLLGWGLAHRRSMR